MVRRAMNWLLETFFPVPYGYEDDEAVLLDEPQRAPFIVNPPFRRGAPPIGAGTCNLFEREPPEHNKRIPWHEGRVLLEGKQKVEIRE